MKWIQDWIAFQAPIEIEGWYNVKMLKIALGIRFGVYKYQRHTRSIVGGLLGNNAEFREAYDWIGGNIDKEIGIKSNYI